MKKIRTTDIENRRLISITAYRASEVDALLSDVAKLVDEAKELITVYDADTPVPLVIDSWIDDIRQAIAAVEARMVDK